MVITITEHRQVEKKIEIDFPYYFKHDLSDRQEYVIYGKKISPEIEVTILECIDDNDLPKYEIEMGAMSSSYFGSKYESNRKEFEEVKQRALKFLKDF